MGFFEVPNVTLRQLTLQLTACNLFGTKPVHIHHRQRICSIDMPQFGVKSLPKPKCGNLRQLTVNASCRKLRVPAEISQDLGVADRTEGRAPRSDTD